MKWSWGCGGEINSNLSFHIYCPVSTSAAVPALRQLCALGELLEAPGYAEECRAHFVVRHHIGSPTISYMLVIVLRSTMIQ